jgi:hypothetical protein
LFRTLGPLFALLEGRLEESLLSELGLFLAFGVSFGDLNGCRDDCGKPNGEREDEHKLGGVFEVHGEILPFFGWRVKGLVVFFSLFQNVV